jgi:hypothetical protein
MMGNYEIVAPNEKPYAAATTWNEAVDKATALTLRMGVLFRVRRTPGPFQKEKLRVVETSMEYIELSRQYPKSFATARAKMRFEAAKRKLDTLLTVYSELQGSDTTERNLLKHPIKAFRSDI